MMNETFSVIFKHRAHRVSKTILLELSVARLWIASLFAFLKIREEVLS